MKSYLIKLPDGTQMGPFPWEKIDKLYASRRISGDDLVWTEGMPAWLPLREVQKQKAEPHPQQTDASDDSRQGKKEESYFLSSGGESRKGPYTLKEISNWYHTGQLSPAAFLWKEGMTEWVRVGEFISSHQGDSSFWGSIFRMLSSLTGLSPIEKFSLKSMFKGMFRRRPEQERIDFFTSGGSKSTPSLEEISTDWPAPWIFIRHLGHSLLMCIGCLSMLEAFNNSPVVAGAASLGLLFAISFAVPFSVLVLFAEFNVRRNISWYSIIVLVLGGGTLSLIVTLILNDLSGNPRAAYWAGPIEELAKLIVVIFFARKFFLNGQILNGMLCGAAVGAGFAGFETAGYIMSTEYGSDPLDTAVLRGILAPFAHVSWSAIMAGAFWLAMKKQRQNSTPPILQPSFWRIAVIPIGLHMFWNSPLLMKSELLVLCKYGICAVICWCMVFLLLNEGLIQVRQAKEHKIDL